MADQDMWDDPSAQLMSELSHAASPPTSSVPDPLDQVLQSISSSKVGEMPAAMQFDGDEKDQPSNLTVTDFTVIEDDEQMVNSQQDPVLVSSDDWVINTAHQANNCSGSPGSSTPAGSPRSAASSENGDTHFEDAQTEHVSCEHDVDETKNCKLNIENREIIDVDAMETETNSPEHEDNEAGDDAAMDAEDEDGSDADTDATSENHSQQPDIPNDDPTGPSVLPEDEVAQAQKRDKTLHVKAKGLIPHTLPPSRYWVAILHHNIEPKDARKEKDFLWIKANRMNTVETVWHTYQNATTEDTFQLVIHNENPEFEDILEELDFYSDKLVVFRALVKKVDEEDDDEECVEESGEEDEESSVKGSGNESEPIVIDDD